MGRIFVCLMSALVLPIAAQTLQVSGRVLDPQGKPVPAAAVILSRDIMDLARTQTGSQGEYQFSGLVPATFSLRAESPAFRPVTGALTLSRTTTFDLQFRELAGQRQSIVISSTTLEPDIERRNAEVFNRTLFTRDDQVLQQADAGINAGQHEGGGKSLEIRRFGFNLDHGGVNGGLKVLVDGVSQNQGTQGHGQGYLGSLKALSPELIEGVTVVNGPFSPEYGDFSGLGVVHIHQRESLADEFTARLQGGNFDTARGFLAWSPTSAKVDSYLAYEGSYTDGPFQVPGQYRRDNVNGNYSRSLDGNQRIGFRFIYGRNNFYSSGQLPTDLIDSGQLDRFGFIDPTDGGRVWLGTLSSYYSKSFANGDTLKADAFLGRSLFDLYSNFTFFLNDPLNGDAFQQHDSRLQDGVNVQWAHVHRVNGAAATFTAGGNFHDNFINVGLYPREGRNPTGVTTRAHAHVTNGAGYGQESLSLYSGHLMLSGGLRFDDFRYGLDDEIYPQNSGVESQGRWQGKGAAAYTPSFKFPLTIHLNYGRGINSVDARSVVERPDQPRLATTDFYQAGTSSSLHRFSFITDVFLINHSNEEVYVPDDGTYEFKGPTRAYGFETKASFELTRHLSLNGGLTKVCNAYYLGLAPRVYVDSAPHFVANAALTLAAWRGWSGSLRMRAINHYRLDGEDPSIVASGHTVFDLGVAKRLSHLVELDFSADNLTSRDYWETQNYFESRTSPYAPALYRIHATPAFPFNAVAGITLRFGGK
jgi:hypothetical protein